MKKEKSEWIKSETDETAVMTISKHNWGRGRSIEEALEKMPSYRAGDELAVIVCFMPKGCLYESINKFGVLTEFWVDEMGSIHYPKGSTIVWMNHSPIKMRKVSKFDESKLKD